MKKIAIFIIVIITVLLTSKVTYSQENYWIGINYELVFNPDGTVKVTVKLHPFDAYGRSLYKNPSVESSILSSKSEIISEVLLMFDTSIEKVRYSIISDFHTDDKEIVVCDIRNTGVLSEMRGAYVLELMVYLNTSSFLKEIRPHIFLVKIRDSYTSMDPRSWIDYIKFSFRKIKLLNYSWVPKFAHGPKYFKNSTLLWINYNEPEAPDKYTFLLYIPYLKLSKAKINASIKKAVISNNILYVVIKNDSKKSRFLFVRAISNKLEQAKKVYISSGGNAYIAFPLPYKPQEVKVQLLYNDIVVDTKVASKGKINIIQSLQVKNILIGVLLLGILLVLISLVKGKKREKTYKEKELYKYASNF